VGVERGVSFIVTFDSDPALSVDDDVLNLVQARATNVPEDEWPDAEEPITPTAFADLALTKMADDERVHAGEQTSFTLRVENVGPSVARGPITVTDTLPEGLTYVEDSAQVAVDGAGAVPLEPSVTGGELTFDLSTVTGTMDPGQVVVITLDTHVGESVYEPEGLVNTAVVDSPDDENPFNNEDSDRVVVDPVSTLAVTKEAVGAFQVGGTGDYRITVENTGPTFDPGPITVVDELPRGLTPVSAPGAEISGNTVTWVIDDGLQVGEKVTFDLQVDLGAKAYPSVTNVVTATTPTPDSPDSDGDQQVSDEVTTDVAQAPDGTPPTGVAVAMWVLIALALLGTGAVVLHTRRRVGS